MQFKLRTAVLSKCIAAVVGDTAAFDASHQSAKGILRIHEAEIPHAELELREVGLPHAELPNGNSGCGTGAWGNRGTHRWLVPHCKKGGGSVYGGAVINMVYSFGQAGIPNTAQTLFVVQKWKQ